jgi:hypothetical protein
MGCYRGQRYCGAHGCEKRRKFCWSVTVNLCDITLAVADELWNAKCSWENGGGATEPPPELIAAGTGAAAA